MKTASEMTYTVSGGALNSAQPQPAAGRMRCASCHVINSIQRVGEINAKSSRKFVCIMERRQTIGVLWKQPLGVEHCKQHSECALMTTMTNFLLYDRENSLKLV